ncbi:MAG: hypothetical protein AAGF01_27170 [Cyanobacteria bacterium P01_G01_bin.38]
MHLNSAVNLPGFLGLPGFVDTFEAPPEAPSLLSIAGEVKQYA